MRNFLRGFVLGAILMFVLAVHLITDAQTDEPLTLRVPPIASDSTWTPAQRADLAKQWGEVITQLNQTNRTVFERLRNHTH